MRRLFARRGPILELAAALWAGAIATANAQSTFNDTKLEAFVTAAIQVDRLIETWSLRIQTAKSEEEALQFRQQANQEMIEVVESTDGISVEEYQAINLAARSDTGLYGRIEAIYDRKVAR